MSQYIKVGAIRYEVVLTNRLLTRGDTKCDAMVKWWESKIEVDKDIGPQQRVEAIWHEVFHIILTQSGRNLEDEEKIVEALAYGIMDVIQNNPKLIEATAKVNA